ncbi:hypothetical protein SD22575_2501 [Shigella dysenteriae 225-75]|nr:hypothetical protein SD22575_2501 [Shigella dysenteriae 225-75]
MLWLMPGGIFSDQTQSTKRKQSIKNHLSHLDTLVTIKQSS